MSACHAALVSAGSAVPLRSNPGDQFAAEADPQAVVEQLVDEDRAGEGSGHRTRAVFDRYNIIEEHDLRDAVQRIEAGIAASSEGGSGQDLDKVAENGSRSSQASPAKRQ